jgi:FMN phosphatase YigB (HAD superfamily)
MIRYVLLDLDDTLLQNSMDTFIPPYFKALVGHLNPYVKPEIMLPALQAGTDAMQHNTNPACTLEQVFDTVFYPAVGIPKEQLCPHLEDFYARVFPTLRVHTRQLPAGQNLVQRLLQEDFKLVIATNALFPRSAVLHRLDWAGLGADIISYELIASYEQFHFAKPSPNYYRDILSFLRAEPDECVMVGNDLEADILPANAVGIQAYHLSDMILPGVQPGWGFGSHAGILNWLSELQ